jgi:hypothetical protein
MGLVLTLILVLLLVSLLPTWPYSRSWGYGPSGLISALLVVLIILMVLSILPVGFGPGPVVGPTPVVVD